MGAGIGSEIIGGLIHNLFYKKQLGLEEANREAFSRFQTSQIPEQERQANVAKIQSGELIEASGEDRGLLGQAGVAPTLSGFGGKDYYAPAAIAKAKAPASAEQVSLINRLHQKVGLPPTQIKYGWEADEAAQSLGQVGVPLADLSERRREYDETERQQAYNALIAPGPQYEQITQRYGYQEPGGELQPMPFDVATAASHFAEIPALRAKFGHDPQFNSLLNEYESVYHNKFEKFRTGALYTGVDKKDFDAEWTHLAGTEPTSSQSGELSYLTQEAVRLSLLRDINGNPLPFNRDRPYQAGSIENMIALKGNQPALKALYIAKHYYPTPESMARGHALLKYTPENDPEVMTYMEKIWGQDAAAAGRSTTPPPTRPQSTNRPQPGTIPPVDTTTAQGVRAATDSLRQGTQAGALPAGQQPAGKTPKKVAPGEQGAQAGVADYAGPEASRAIYQTAYARGKADPNYFTAATDTLSGLINGGSVEDQLSWLVAHIQSPTTKLSTAQKQQAMAVVDDIRKMPPNSRKRRARINAQMQIAQFAFNEAREKALRESQVMQGTEVTPGEAAPAEGEGAKPKAKPSKGGERKF